MYDQLPVWARTKIENMRGVIDSQKQQIEALKVALTKTEAALARKRVRNARHRINDGVSEKKCNLCSQWYTLSTFSKNRTKGDGYSAQCKYCISKYMQERTRKKKEQIENEQRSTIADREQAQQKMPGRERIQGTTPATSARPIELERFHGNVQQEASGVFRRFDR